MPFGLSCAARRARPLSFHGLFLRVLPRAWFCLLFAWDCPHTASPFTTAFTFHYAPLLVPTDGDRCEPTSENAGWPARQWPDRILTCSLLHSCAHACSSRQADRQLASLPVPLILPASFPCLPLSHFWGGTFDEQARGRQEGGQDQDGRALWGWDGLPQAVTVDSSPPPPPLPTSTTSPSFPLYYTTYFFGAWRRCGGDFTCATTPFTFPHSCQFFPACNHHFYFILPPPKQVARARGGVAKQGHAHGNARIALGLSATLICYLPSPFPHPFYFRRICGSIPSRRTDRDISPTTHPFVPPP